MKHQTQNSKGYIKWRKCDRKKKFTSIDDAMNQGKFTIAITKKPLYTYLCDLCSHWHLTARPTKHKVI